MSTITPNFSPEDSETTNIWELFLARLRYRNAHHIKVPANQPLLLSPPDTVWVVYRGSVNLFTVSVEDGKPVGSRQYLMTARAGSLLPGFDLEGRGLGILASGTPETELLQMPVSTLRDFATQPEFAEIVVYLLNRWIERLTTLILPHKLPQKYTFINVGDNLSVETGQVIRSLKDVVWVWHDAARSAYMDQSGIIISGESFAGFPLTRDSWLIVQQAGQLEGNTTQQVLAADPEWSLLEQYNTLILDLLIHRQQTAEVIERQRLHDKNLSAKRYLQQAFRNLSSVMGEQEAIPIMMQQDNLLLMTAILVGNQQGIKIIPSPPVVGESLHDPIQDIARAARIRVRKVALIGRWWEAENGALLGYTIEEQHPVALLPYKNRGYRVHDLALDTVTVVDEDVAARLSPFGMTFYRSLINEPMGGWELLRFGLRDSRADLWKILLLGVGIGTLQLLTPWVSRLIFDETIPNGDRGQFFQIGIALVMSALAVALFRIVQVIAVMRVGSQVEGAVQAAVWDRLLELPTVFFRNYTSGDLAERAMGITTIRQALAGTVTMSILAGVFSLLNLGLLIYYDLKLALVSLVLAVASAAVMVLVGSRNIRVQRLVVEASGRLTGYVLQFIYGMNKFRASGSESRAFAFWADQFSEKRRLEIKARGLQNSLVTFNSAYPVLALMVIFWMVVYTSTGDFSVGTFVAFNTAFGQFLSAVLQLSAAVLVLLSTVPVYERLKPILEHPLEVDESKSPPGLLSGDIEMKHVSFRYAKDAPLVLDDISFQVRRGEFVAIVGPSGSGKSTVLRLLLGFEKTDSGVIYYDNQDLSQLDLRAVRRQAGIVLQTSQLMSGSSIFSNIVGVTNLTLNDAEEAAKMSGLADDIKEMPMGMHTIVAAEGGTLSGGQRQRLMIARAIVTRPRILFFDEATSALDNRTQAIVSQSLEQLDATRIVIAHRLSTIMNADKIIVMQNGRIVQTGRYHELMKEKGMFQELARRQLT